MKVLHLCPLWFPIGRDAPGGIETFLARLIIALEKLGCRNTLVAAGRTTITPRLIRATAAGVCGMMARGTATEYAFYEQHQIALAIAAAPEFDIIHSHIGSPGYCLSALGPAAPPVLHTQHIPVLMDQPWFLQRHPEMWFSTVSQFQFDRLRHPRKDRCFVVPNGVKISEFKFKPRSRGGLFFIGRIERAKGPDLAVKVARQLGLPLVLAGPIVSGDDFNESIRPYLNDQIRYIGAINHAQKNEEFGRAACTILPFRGEESFGLVSVESMACGTPVVALSNGAIPEVIDPGVTGYVTKDAARLGSLIVRAMKLDRTVVRQRAAARFDVGVVAHSYHQLYQKMASERDAS